MTRKIIIAIDGHSSCGKSTLAKSLAQALGYCHVDSGSMYRAVTHWFLMQGTSLVDIEMVKEHLDAIDLTLKVGSTSTQVEMQGKILNAELRDPAVNAAVSDVAKISMVRKKLVEMQRRESQGSGIVMDGRDIGSVVFPDAELKIFLTARLEVRTERRYLEMREMGIEIDRSEVERNLKRRDEIDSSRLDSPLILTKDAVQIDNSNLTPKEQLGMILSLAKARGA